MLGLFRNAHVFILINVSFCSFLFILFTVVSLFGTTIGCWFGVSVFIFIDLRVVVIIDPRLEEALTNLMNVNCMIVLFKDIVNAMFKPEESSKVGGVRKAVYIFLL